MRKVNGERDLRLVDDGEPHKLTRTTVCSTGTMPRVFWKEDDFASAPAPLSTLRRLTSAPKFEI